MANSTMRAAPFALSDNDLARLHEATMAILADPGVRFTQEAALDVFREAGYEVQGDVVRFRRADVEEMVAKAPSSFVRKGIDASCDVAVGDGSLHFALGSIPLWVVDPDDYPEYGDDSFVAEMAELFVNRYPPMQDSESTTAYASLYAVTPDWHPIVDEVPAGSGSLICSGFSGHGYKLAPAVGVMVADLVTGEESPEFPSRLFRFARFGEGDLVRGRYEYSIAG